MFSLVQFDNGEYSILPSKRVKIVQGKDCIIKYTGGGKYSADLIDSSDIQDNLIDLKTKLEQNENLINKENSSHLSNRKSNHSSDSSQRANQILQIKEMGFSTPLNNNSPTVPNLEISNISLNNLPTVLSNTNTELESSSPRSGFTDKLESLGPNWPNISTDEKSREVNSNEESCNSKIIQDNSSNDNMNEEDMSQSNNNDNKNDPSYDPKQSTHSATSEMSFTIEKSSIKEKSSSLDNGCPLDIRKLSIPVTTSEKGKIKKHFCSFCNTLQTKFARHLKLKHKNEEEVKKFIYLPNKNKERIKIIDTLRKKGDFLHNTKPELNSGILIVSRQRQKKSKNSVEDYVCCKTCQGFFARNTIRIHYSKCNKFHKKGDRNIFSSSRRLCGYIHSCANETLRRHVFPILRNDEVSRCIKYDELIIQFGNKLCDKYTLTHQHDMIRAQLRLLGRFKLEIIALDNEIHEFKDIFKPQNFDKAIDSLRKVAHWDLNIMWFRTPAVAQNLTTLIKKCAHKFRTECIKNQDHERKKSVEDFLLLWEEEVPTLINKKALEDQINQKRRKKIVLPSKQDIKLLYDYLKKECNTCLEILDNEFNLNAWILLTQCTLIFIQIFNRRRAGEIERLTLINYQNKEALDENVDQELYKQLSNSTKEFAKQFVRLTLRGKLGRTVSVLLSPFVIQCIETILKFRKYAGVSSNNEYIFSVPHTNRLSKKYLRACPLMRRFANECGALIPSTLRGTMLRKHIATYTSMLNIEDCQIDRLANFMGHHKDIHKNIYRMPVPVAEITDVSRLLMAAIGHDDKEDDEENSEENSDDNENSDESSDEEDAHVMPAMIERTNANMDNIDHTSTFDSENTFSPLSTNNSTNSKCRNTSPFGKTKRTKWTDREKEAITKHFGNLQNLSKLPSLQECRKVILKYRVLNQRTPQQVKTWIDNQKRVKNRQQSYICSKNLSF
ncbi:uncharacterized protein LOC114931205 [Nylanderia fulva]|uniref:uncharacterized protein LOC114931205 n=1 Tax=Nylanderia fulva TaxID=613905 RepID=UPI0010FBAB0A|nr:uncharacterized protein LOC114931205 [Nylanderia fulva]